MNDFIIRVDSSEIEVKIINENELNYGEEKINYELLQTGNSYLLKLNNKVYVLTAEKIDGESFKVLVDGYQFEITARTMLQEKAFKLIESSSSHRIQHTEVKAPMPGLILRILKSAGEKVNQGDSVMILEAMKMENDLKTPASGIIDTVFVKQGEAVEKGAKLFSIV